MTWLRRIEKDREGNDCEGQFLRNLTDSLQEALHHKHKLGQSNQDAKYVQYWRNVQEHVLADISNGYWDETTITDPAKRNTNKYKWGQLWHMGKAWLYKAPYMKGQAIASNCKCPLCGLQDSGGHILGGCTHPGNKKLIIYRHDEAHRVIINAFNKGNQGSHLLIADVGTRDLLKELGVHYKRIPEWVLPDEAITHQDADSSTTPLRDKLRPDIMLVELTAAERHAYLTASRNARLTALPTVTW